VAALHAARRDGTLSEEHLTEAARRLDHALHHFPGTPRPYPGAQQSADRAELLSWANRHLQWQGERVPLDPDRPVLLLAQGCPDIGGPYGDRLPGETLAAALREAFPALTYSDLSDLQATEQALTAHPDTPVLLATTGRWTLPAGAHALAERLSDRAAPALHLALWSADAASQLPLPAVITHGFRTANLEALKAALLDRK